ncbi:MAG: enoyl-CoA hydratase [Xanthomonadales bacterium]|nr:enoyl-CoA hydratase [Xanthomonadales bacterium]
MSEHILTHLEDGILTLRMQRPEKKNALTGAMYASLAEAIGGDAGERGVRVVVIAGVEGAFTAGNDLEDFLNNPPRDAEAPVNRFITALATTDLPLVAAVDGLAVGIGTTLLLHCEQVLATGRSRFSLPFVNLGLVPENGSSLLLVQSCGYRKAAELLMLGEPFSAADALDCGIVSRLVEPAELESEARALARKLAARPRDALRATKRLMRRPAEPLAARIEAESKLFAQFLGSPEAKEAFTAFLEKRPPDFSRFG